MTPIERQSLWNDLAIMKALVKLSNDEDRKTELIEYINDTDELLEEKKEEEPCCEMPEREETRE